MNSLVSLAGVMTNLSKAVKTNINQFSQLYDDIKGVKNQVIIKETGVVNGEIKEQEIDIIQLQ